MVKQRMTAADVAAEAACLRATLQGLRLANIYDINSKTYVLKLSKSGGEGEKVLLVLESGVRFHTSQVMRDKSDIPSNFTLKLRKHLRTRRLEQVRQLGMDRAVDFVFGNGEHAHHLILEMYSQGNVILTDYKYEVLTLLRSHRDDDKGLAIMSRHPYPIHALRLAEPLQRAQLQQALENADANMNLKGVLSGLMPYGPALAEHCLLTAGLQPNSKAAGLNQQDQPVGQLYAAVKQLEDWFAGLESQAPEGYIIKAAPGSKKNKANKQANSVDGVDAVPDPADDSKLMYVEYLPLQLAQFSGQPFSRFETFDAAMDEFYSKIEVQRAAAAKLEAERNALSKLDKIRQDQGQRAQALLREAEEEDMKAQLIEYNLESVDAAIAAVNEALATGMDWKDLERMIKEERKAGNPIAGLIHSLQLEQNRATLLLSNLLDADEDDEEALTRPATKVVVDLSLTAHANAAAHFEARKKHAAKQAKTLAANEQALKAAEKKAQVQLQKARLVASVQVVRKPLWFERFYWFITSENYLVLSGRDAQQNELLVKRYFRKGDVYVHADLHGASSTIVKNHTPEQPLPPLTLQQAGCACVCRSKAWDNKVVTSAYWVHHHQVSKSAPTGEYLTTGSFMVRGKKNYLPPQPLVFGLGFMFKLEDSSIARHLGERAVRGLGDEDVSYPDGRSAERRDEQEEEEEEDDDAVSEGEGPGSSAAWSTQPSSIPDDASQAKQAMSTQASSNALEEFLDASLDVMSASRHFERYGLQLIPTSSAPEEEGAGDKAAEKSAQPINKRHLSAAEKKVLKAGGKPGPSGTQPPGRGPQDKQKDKALHDKGPGKVANGAVPPKTQDKAVVDAEQKESAPGPDKGGRRGKTGKQKKVKEKYAEQDEEERELALLVLGSEGSKKSRAERRAVRKERKAATVTPLPPTLNMEQGERQAAIARATGRQWGKGAQQEAHPEPTAASTTSQDTSQEFRAGQGHMPRAEEAESSGGEEEEQRHGGANGQHGGDEEKHQQASNPTNGSTLEPGITSSGLPSDVAQHSEHQDPTHTLAGNTPAVENGSVARTNGTTEATTASVMGDEEIAEAYEPGARNENPSVEEAAEVSALLAEENLAELGDEDRDRLTVVDSLTGLPHADDTLLFAVPVCGPYNCMTNWKYKVKLIPGTLRKGKAAKQAVDLLTRTGEVVQRERDLLKAVPDTEVINTLLGTVKMSMPGMTKLKQNDRKSKKGKS